MFWLSADFHLLYSTASVLILTLVYTATICSCVTKLHFSLPKFLLWGWQPQGLSLRMIVWDSEELVTVHGNCTYWWTSAFHPITATDELHLIVQLALIFTAPSTVHGRLVALCLHLLSADFLVWLEGPFFKLTRNPMRFLTSRLFPLPAASSSLRRHNQCVCALLARVTMFVTWTEGRCAAAFFVVVMIRCQICGCFNAHTEHVSVLAVFLYMQIAITSHFV